MPKLSERVGTFTDSVIRRMTRISDEYGAINLSQGFPDFDPPKEMMEALKKASGFIRRELSHRMQLRLTPELIFELDTNIEYAAHINELLRQTEAPHEESSN